jgi:hypothetical protein
MPQAAEEDAMIFPGSRYQKTGIYTVEKSDGTVVAALKLPLPGAALVQGYCRRRPETERLDLIANFFLKDATAFWELCDANSAVVPDALAARELIGIPPTGS